jgi:carboxyl-terminal processing protease
MKKIKGIIAVILVLVFVIAGNVSVWAADYGSYFNSMLKFIQDMYYEGLTDQDGLKAALKGMMSVLDDYSAFYDKEETEALNNTLNGNFTGIGAALEKFDRYIVIVKIYENSPAEKAGLIEGDIITAVNGESVADKDPTQVAAMIRGEEGTVVNITIKRGSIVKDFSIIRGVVNINPVRYRIEGKTAYIKIESFSSGASQKFNEALSAINKNKIRKIILDLRGNPGGYVNEAVNIAKKLIPPGIVTTLDYKSDKISDQTYISNQKNPFYILAVLVDQKTASASEILAGAIEDSESGFLIGQNTFGKGVFQSIYSVLTPEAFLKYSKLYGEQYVTNNEWMSYYGVIPDPDEILGTIKLTTGYYLTPKGRKIDGVGLKPNFEVANPADSLGLDLAAAGLLSNTGTIEMDHYSNDVYNAEMILKASGYLTSTPDRKFGFDTAEAVENYQKDKNLQPTGKIDIKTRDFLNKTLLELRNTKDLQYAKAVELLGIFKD